MNQYLEPVIRSINENPWVVFIVSLLALVSFGWNIYEYFRDRNRIRELSYAMTSVSVVSPKNFITDLKVTFQGIQVVNLSVSKVVLYSSGRIAVRKDDIPVSSKICILSSDTIYNYRTVTVSNESNRITIERGADKKSLIVDFQYMECKQGVLVKVYHAGELSVGGTVIDGKLKNRRVQDERGLSHVRSLIGEMGLAFLVGIIGAVWEWNFSYLLVSLGALLFMLLGFRMLHIDNPIPHSLNSFHDENDLSD